MDELVIEPVGEEILIYDLRSDNIHCLEATIAKVFNSVSQGNSSPSDIVRQSGLDAFTVEQGLDTLFELGLIEALEPSPQLGSQTSSRRQLLKMAGATAAAGVVGAAVSSIAAPTPAYAATCLTACTPNEHTLAVNADAVITTINVAPLWDVTGGTCQALITKCGGLLTASCTNVIGIAPCSCGCCCTFITLATIITTGGGLPVPLPGSPGSVLRCTPRSACGISTGSQSCTVTSRVLPLGPNLTHTITATGVIGSCLLS